MPTFPACPGDVDVDLRKHSVSVSLSRDTAQQMYLTMYLQMHGCALMNVYPQAQNWRTITEFGYCMGILAPIRVVTDVGGRGDAAMFCCAV